MSAFVRNSSRISSCLILICIVSLFLCSCGSGSSGGTTTPFISAMLASYPSGSAPINYRSAWVVVKNESIGGNPISNALVSLNGVPLTYNAMSQVYDGDVVVPPGGSVTLSVSVGGKTYTASGTQLTTYPTITAPASGSKLAAGMAQTVTWTNGDPTTNANYLLGVVDAANPNGQLVWPSNNNIFNAMGNTTFSIPEDSLTAGNRLIIVGIGTTMPILNAASGSSLLLSGFNCIPITVIVPTTIASGLSRPYGIALDSTNIYWTENIGGTVKKVGLNGGAVTTIASALTNPVMITADVNNLYFTKFDYSNIGSLIKMDKNGDAQTTIASGIVAPFDLVVDSANIYWAEAQSVKRTGLNGGTVTVLATGLNGAQNMAIDSSYIYWTDSNLGTVKKVGLNGGQVTTLAAGLNGPAGIAVDATSVYWTETDGRSVKKVGINGGVITTLSSGLVRPVGITVDSSSVYWTDYLGGTLNTVGINGGPVSTLAAKLNGPTKIVIDPTNVYWIDQDGGAIKKIAK